LSAGSRHARRRRERGQRRDGAEAQVPPPGARRSDDAHGGLGQAGIRRQTGRHELGRPERVRYLHDVQRHRARRHEIQGLVDVTTVIWSESGKRADARGFTMIELLVVMSLLVVLASVGLAQYRSSVVHSREAVLKEDLFRMRDAIDQYYADKGQYPTTVDSLVSEGYLRKLPEDPFTHDPSSWQTIPSEPDPNNPSAAPGVYDVKSGSDQTALDGSKYADW